jgi:hypothetical protein
MKKTELKKLLKPIIKECIKEVMFEDGILAGIVSEVATGMGGVQIIEARHREEPTVARDEEKFTEMRQKSLQNQQQQQLDEHKQKLLNSIGKDSYNGIDLFEGTTPLKSPGAPAGSSPTAQGPLANVDSNDSGVDISNLFSSVGRSWQAHMNSAK